MRNLLNPGWLLFLLSAFTFAWERLKYRFRKTNGRRRQFTHTLPGSTDSSAPFGE